MIDIKKALTKIYFSEFEIIDGLNQHPRGLNYYEWLIEQELVDESNALGRMKEVRDLLVNFGASSALPRLERHIEDLEAKNA